MTVAVSYKRRKKEYEIPSLNKVDSPLPLVSHFFISPHTSFPSSPLLDLYSNVYEEAISDWPSGELGGKNKKVIRGLEEHVISFL